MPLTTSYYLLNDAGIKDMRLWLREDTSQILQRREAFVHFLMQDFKVPFNVSLLTTEEALYVENTIGGVVPYTGSHESGLRIVTSVASSTSADKKLLEPRQYTDHRLIEVGFKYEITSSDVERGALGRPGSVVKQGVYLIDEYRGSSEESIDGMPLEPWSSSLGSSSPQITFQTILPSVVNEVNHAILYESVTVTASGNGVQRTCNGTYLATSIQYPSSSHSPGSSHTLLGSFQFSQCSGKPVSRRSPIEGGLC